MDDKLFMVWTFNTSERMYRTLEDYAHLMGQVGIFNFTVDINGRISGTVESRLLSIIPKYPDVKWLLTIQNYGTSYQVVEALLYNASARSTFLSEIQRLIDTYSWCGGIDIDIENAGSEDNQVAMQVLFRDIYNVVHTRNGLHMNICLPPITGPNASVGGEYWCAYEDYVNCTDTMTLMSYAFAWLGSAPGPVSPDWWLEDILEYATSVVPKDMILIGMGAWMILWALHKQYEGYGAESGTFYYALLWMEGEYNWSIFGDGEPEAANQPYIPTTGYFDEYQKICYILPQVYDYVDAPMYDTTQALVYGEQEGREYSVSYEKEWMSEGSYNQEILPSDTTGDVYIDSDGLYAYAESENATMTYYLVSGTTRSYDIYIVLGFPWYNLNEVDIYLGDDLLTTITETRWWHPTFRYRTPYKVTTRIINNNVVLPITVRVRNGKTGIPIYGFVYAPEGTYTTRMTAGIAEYSSIIHPMIDVNKNEVYPDDGFALTSEVLLSAPDSANIWYDDFRSYDRQSDFEGFFNVNTGTCTFIEVSDTQHILATASTFNATLAYNGFEDGHVHCRFNGLGPGQYAGIVFRELRLFFDYDDQSIELWGNQGSSLITSRYIGYQPVGISMRVAFGQVKVYVGSTSQEPLFTVNFTPDLDLDLGVGLAASQGVQYTLFRFGSGIWYDPYEQVTMTLTDHKGYSLSWNERPTRSDVAWDPETLQFEMLTNKNEHETRDYRFSADYVFRYSNRITDNNLDITGGPLTLTVEHNDINVRYVRSYLGDADGFGIAYYEDADVIQNWYNRAIHEYGIKGLCMWSLGQEDWRIWERLANRNKET